MKISPKGGRAVCTWLLAFARKWARLELLETSQLHTKSNQFPLLQQLDPWGCRSISPLITPHNKNLGSKIKFETVSKGSFPQILRSFHAIPMVFSIPVSPQGTVVLRALHRHPAKPGRIHWETSLGVHPHVSPARNSGHSVSMEHATFNVHPREKLRPIWFWKCGTDWLWLLIGKSAASVSNSAICRTPESSSSSSSSSSITVYHCRRHVFVKKKHGRCLVKSFPRPGWIDSALQRGISSQDLLGNTK